MDVVGNVQLVQGDASSVTQLFELLRRNGIEPAANPDVEVRMYAQFLVDDARALCARALTKSFSASRRVFIVIAANLTYEAQNTMLKTLEEPPGDALFFFVVPAPETLLPTIRSRAQMLLVGENVSESRVDAAAFLAARPAERLLMLKPLLDKGDDDVRDISGVVTFLSALECKLAERNPLPREGVEAVYRARKYAGDKGSLLKTLLEQVALLVPITK